MIDVIEGCIRADRKEKEDAQELRERMLMLAVQAYGSSYTEDVVIGAAEEFRKYVKGENNV